MDIQLLLTPAITLAAAIFLWVAQKDRAKEVKEHIDKTIELTFKMLDQKIDSKAELLQQKIETSSLLVAQKMEATAELLRQSIGTVDKRVEGMDKLLSDMNASQLAILARLPEKDATARAQA